MKYVAVIENVSRSENINLIGEIVIVDKELTVDIAAELCYRESSLMDYGIYDRGRKRYQEFTILHSVSNLEIIGIY